MKEESAIAVLFGIVSLTFLLAALVVAGHAAEIDLGQGAGEREPQQRPTYLILPGRP